MTNLTAEEKSFRLKQIRYWIGWLSRGFASGQWNSFFLGRGFDFQGIAPFIDDPDFIRINWPATLNSGELQVSQFSEERNIDMYLLGSLSPSMAFGSQVTKLERLATMAAVLSFSAFKLKDRFRFLGFTQNLENRFPKSGDQSYPLLLAKSIIDFDWQGKRGGGMLKAALSVPSQRSLVIIVSDHLSENGDIEKSLRYLVPNHEVIAIALWDEREVSLPGKGWGIYPLQDLETGEISYIFLTNKNRKRFEENSRLRRQALNDLYSRYGIPLTFMIGGRSEDDIEALIRIFLSKRNLV